MWHFLIGYVILQIEGISVARFLRRLTESGIAIRNLSRDSSGSVVRFAIDRTRFFDLHRLKSGLPVRIRIVKRCGLPFLVQKMRRRPALWIGIIVMLFAITFASDRIWMIRIEGAETVRQETIDTLLKEYGLRTGARPKGAVLIEAANDMSVRIPEAAWIGLDSEGVTLIVKVVEALPESEKTNLCATSDIVATKDGIVTAITVMRGQACVKVGDAVKKGDVLITGTVRWKDTSYQTAAIGTVQAAVRYESVCELPASVTEAVLINETETVRSLCIGTFTILEKKPSYERYRLEESNMLPVSDRFPVYCRIRTVQRIVLRDRELSEQEAEQTALMNARESALDTIPKDAMILNQYGTIRTIRGKKQAAVIITAEETIGRTEDNLNDG